LHHASTTPKPAGGRIFLQVNLNPDINICFNLELECSKKQTNKKWEILNLCIVSECFDGFSLPPASPDPREAVALYILTTKKKDSNAII